MSAKNSDEARVRELYRVLQETKQRVRQLDVSKDSFLSEDTVVNRAIADSLLMCVFRATEEAGNMSPETRQSYPQIEWSGIHNHAQHPCA